LHRRSSLLPFRSFSTQGHLAFPDLHKSKPVWRGRGAHMTDASGTFNLAGRRAFFKIFHMRLWLFQTIWRSNHGVDACNATSVDVAFA
jgi:hypothetical protein